MWRSVTLVGGFIACIPAANWLIGHVGTTCVPAGPCLIPVGFGLMAPSGVLMIGAALVLRDLVQEAGGRALAIACIAMGAMLSLFVSPPALAIASAVAFALSEAADFVVYDRLRRRQLAIALLLSGVVGAALDTLIFSVLAFGTVKWAPGLLLAKMYASAAVAAWATLRAGVRVRA